uniref:Uncharacterized protein n=1 Tax=viral metagenome TaxID=1070528 RepID=A0A6H1ZE34_9ZZZZ
MSACSCGIETIIGGRISPVQTARKPGFECATCGVLVEPGQKCVDIAYLYDDTGGFFRLHAVCFELTRRFKEKVCGFEEWFGGMPLDEAVEHAVSQGHDPFWRDWLILYEQTWEWLPPLSEKPERGLTCEDCIRFAICQRERGVSRFSSPWWPKRSCPPGVFFEECYEMSRIDAALGEEE